MAVQTLLVFLILASAFPVGYLLAYLCKEELAAGRKYFKILAWLAVVLAIIFLLFYRDFSIILTLAYISIVALISVHKSYNKKIKKK